MLLLMYLLPVPGKFILGGNQQLLCVLLAFWKAIASQICCPGLQRHSSSDVIQAYCKTYCKGSFVKPLEVGQLPSHVPCLSMPVCSKFLINSTAGT